jgi:predicted ester cyclase
MNTKYKHLAAAVAVFATVAAAPTRSADEPPAAQRWLTSSPGAERNVKNFILAQTESVAGKMTNIDEYLAPEYVVDSRGDDSLQKLLGKLVPGRRTVKREGLEKVSTAPFAGMQGHKRVMEEIYGVGDEVIAKWRVQGVVTGSLFGLQGHGQAVDFEEISFARYDKDGRLVEGWYRIDSAELLRQLGYTVQPPQ